MSKQKEIAVFREIKVGEYVLRFWPSDNGWMCGITPEMMQALQEPQEKYTYGTPLLDAMTGKQPAPPPECQTDAEKTAFAFGWWKALEHVRQQPAQQEPVKLRRGDILRCIETDELCTVWSTSTTGRTLVKWSANDFGNYTAEQIGELFWLEPEPDDLELAAEKSDNYAAFHAGYRFSVARGNTGDNT